MLTRLIRGNELRKTRFHDEKGNLVPAAAWPYMPAALASAALKAVLGIRSERPMISYRAAREIAGLMTPSWRVVEFGSGYSTPWLARRCAFLLSIEDNPAWHAVVEGLLDRAGLREVRYERRAVERYADLDGYADGYFDLALVDGTDRDGCVRSALRKVRKGGLIYLDNSDKDMTIPGGDLRRAEAALLAGVRERGGTVRYFTDFSPTNFFAEQGVLATV
jgi:hypothetical protein